VYNRDVPKQILKSGRRNCESEFKKRKTEGEIAKVNLKSERRKAKGESPKKTEFWRKAKDGRRNFLKFFRYDNITLKIGQIKALVANQSII